MSYSCPTGCGYEGGLTAMMNHLRLKQDEEHTQMYQKFKQKADNNVDQEEQEDEDDRPKLEDSFEESMQNDSEGSQADNMEVKELHSGEEDEEDKTDYRPINKVEFTDVVDQGHAKDVETAKKMLLKAQKKGFEKIQMETGEMK